MLPVSAMDIRKVQNIVREIYAGGKIQVKITEDLDSISNSDMILAIGSEKTITYEYQTSSETIRNYFKKIDEENVQLLTLIDKFVIASNVFFPIFGFSKICKTILRAETLKNQQVEKLKHSIKSMSASSKKSFSDKKHSSIYSIIIDEEIPKGGKYNAMLWGILKGNIQIDDLETYLRSLHPDNSTAYRKLICAFDFRKYSDIAI